MKSTKIKPQIQSKPKKSISYRTGRYGRNVPVLTLDRNDLFLFSFFIRNDERHTPHVANVFLNLSPVGWRFSECFASVITG
ncbi:hypothetical protein SLEP1_g30630 [Rubroshorea leprosula]|uniref:Uncharacterized protein n=1 Tax=Rubroshorea leprosula TaxID=152421 RepID=A0AAV5KAK9_9ROSI|nr:hypothetical protein SLEP1_g30630 [Rubroshorea leprosula]